MQSLRIGGVALWIGLATGCFADVDGGDEAGVSGDETGETGETASATDSGEGPTTSNGLSGAYDVMSRTVACNGDCSASAGIWGIVSYCDVGEMATDYVRVNQEGGALTIDLSQGQVQGAIEENGRFSVGGAATEGGGMVELNAVADGQFQGRHVGFTAQLSFTAIGQIEGDVIDCKGEIELTADWVSDECSADPQVCPDDYPICHNDACNAGVDGDPCWSNEQCGAGFVCLRDTCRQPADVGGDCLNDEHCASPNLCFEDVCQAGALGDACDFDDHCAPPLLCFDGGCHAGAVGDPCSGSSDCAQDLLCVRDLCQVGNVGDPCDFDSDCAAGLMCVDEACSAGNPGDACEWSSDCLSDSCENEVCG